MLPYALTMLSILFNIRKCFLRKIGFTTAPCDIDDLILALKGSSIERNGLQPVTPDQSANRQHHHHHHRRHQPQRYQHRLTPEPGHQNHHNQQQQQQHRAPHQRNRLNVGAPLTTRGQKRLRNPRKRHRRQRSGMRNVADPIYYVCNEILVIKSKYLFIVSYCFTINLLKLF